jgi:uncharacterized protein
MPLTPLRRLRQLLYFVPVLALFAASWPLAARPAEAVSANVVISQVYGGGGNTGATYTHDYIELFNRGTAAVSLAGWSVQYASNTGTGNLGANSGQLSELPAITLQPGQYLLIQEFSNGAVGAPLPTVDVTDATPINMSGTAGKVALVSSTASLGCNGGSTLCDATQLALIVDLVGYGTANFYEGAGPAATISATLANFRAAGGCTDTDNNNADFAAATPAARNTATALNVCPSVPVTPNLTIDDVQLSEGAAGTTAFNFTVSLSAAAGAGGVTFDITTQDGSATVADNDYAANSLTGQTILAGNSTYAFTVLVNGDAATEGDETFLVNVSNVAGATVTDGQGQGTIQEDDINYCLQTYTPIYAIQGSGSAAAITGNTTTQGVVVGDFEGTSGLSGFYLQDAAGDGNAATSDGIFVFTGASNLVSAGDVVRVTGYARERFDQTTLNGSDSNSAAVPAANILNCGTGSVAPVDVSLPFASPTDPERFEGMLVRLPQALVISEYFDYDRFGEIVLALPLEGEPRAFTPTAIDEPGAPALVRAAANALRRITLDDGLSVQNPLVVRHPNGAAFSLDNKFRGGDTVQNTVGVLGYDFNKYRIQPTGAANYTAVNPRTNGPEPVGGSLRVSAMNTLNFFLTLDYVTGNPLDNKCGPANSLECRGADADQPDEFTRQRDKLIAALLGLEADVIGLNELENSTGVEPLGDPINGVVAGLNAALGAGTYAYIDTGVIGTDAIRVGIIYKPGAVTPVGDFKLLNSTVDPRFIDTKSRPALAQTFKVVATGARFTLVVNHLKSKGSPCTDVGDADAGDGQGNCNGTRTAAAQALVDWLATDPTGSGDADFLIMGDLNSYAQEDPVDAIRAGADDIAGTGDDFTNLIALYQGTHAYSYVFDGQAGYLDHALANASLAAQVTGAADWHLNADEPDLLDYDTSFKPATQDALYEANAYRSSDHDSVTVGLNLNDAPTVDAGGPYTVTEGSAVTVTATGSDPNLGDSLSYAWDLDNNGTYETAGQSASFSAGLTAPSSYIIGVQVTDSGGLTATDTATVVVIYNFTGFFAPVDNLPVFNIVSAGSGVPVRFSLSGDQGLNILAAGYPKSEPIACSATAAADSLEETVATSANALKYDAATDLYSYFWKTNKSWAGTCRQLVIQLNDGTFHRANFRFK